MANQYLIRTDETAVRAWVFIGILQGLVETFRIKIPVLDVYGGNDWTVILQGASERNAQVRRIAGSAQIEVAGAKHFFEDREEELLRIIVTFLDKTFGAPPVAN
jgi:pimeloyl-ACP methyl ester carboxylesterase